jgi:hypothetical protein
MFHTKFVEKIKTIILEVISLENHVVYDIMWKTVADPHRPQMTV